MENKEFFDEKTYRDILYRIGYFRNKYNLSARETSLQLGFSDSFMNRIERNCVELKVSTLLSFMNLINIKPIEFFYPKPENYEKDKEILNLIMSLSEDNKNTIIDLAKKLK